jgi:hypothetical protein
MVIRWSGEMCGCSGSAGSSVERRAERRKDSSCVRQHDKGSSVIGG